MMSDAADLNVPLEPADADFDIASMFSEREGERYALHSRYMNEMMVRLLRTIGYDISFCRGKGQYLFDRTGARYLDLLSGWGVFGIGRNHPKLREALTNVLASDLPNLVQMDVSPLAGILAQRLLRYTPYLEKVYFANSGSDAVEAAVKFSRRATGRPGFVHCAHAFHGLSYGALSLNGDANFRDGFGPFLPGCVEVPFNDLAALEKALASRQMAAFIVEPLQGKVVSAPDDGYLAGVSALCRKYGTLFIVPVAAVLARKGILEKVFDRMDRAVVHGSTFAMNDLAMAAGIATLEILESERITENAARQGARLIAFFKAMVPRYEMVKAVHGKGLMIGIEFGRPQSLKLQAAWHLLEAVSTGLFCQLITIPLLKDHNIVVQVAGHASHTVKLLPSLVISDSDCDWIENSFSEVIAEGHCVPGAVWSLGKTLAEQARKARAGMRSDHDRSQSSS
jgi:ornithine--oxo-acid transaminase